MLFQNICIFFHHCVFLNSCVAECGGDLSGPAGSFSYPNTPGHDEYDHQVSCTWVLRTDPNKVSLSLLKQRRSCLTSNRQTVLSDPLFQILRVTFPYFHLEQSTGCIFDFLQIHDGDSPFSYMIGKYCGQTAPAELHSSHNALYFWFRSDSSNSGGGFTVTWQAEDPGGNLSFSVYS